MSERMETIAKHLKMQILSGHQHLSRISLLTVYLVVCALDMQYHESLRTLLTPGKGNQWISCTNSRWLCIVSKQHT